MIEYLKMSLALWAAKFLFALMLFGIVVALVLLHYLWITFKQWRCKHLRKHENMACHLICSTCGKDLGFIGSYKGPR